MKPYHHLDIRERVAIKNGLDAKLTIQEIARPLGRPPITIKREIFRNRVRQTIQEVQYCRITRNDCTKRITCTRTNLCAYCVNKMPNCSYCERCNEVCEAFVQTGCDRRDRTHGCCNACSNSRSCKLRRWYYRPKEAQKLADTRLVESRTGSTLTQDELLRLNEIVSEGLRKGQSLHAIIAANRDEIFCSERTLYKLVATGRFDAKVLDMPLVVRRRVRKKAVEHKVDRGCRIGRTYEDFKAWKEQRNGIQEVQMDTVHGQQGIHKTLLTLYWTSAHFLLLLLLDRCTAGAVNEVFRTFHEKLGKKRFQKLFPVILTDRGSEFRDPLSIEGPEGETWTKLFYCDAYKPQQKGAIEQEHAIIRRILPKGTSFDRLNNEDIALVNAHITSYPRPGLNGRTPQDMFGFIYGEKISELFGIDSIEPCNVVLKPRLLNRAK